ncbi:hypothetical protein M3N64_05460 [Sporolactobacillus sp. CPB3-1]|uniref:Uncharacterized protein n=1 Tax=Sporolactobacillus mangiferae TaxID=2940498 RepID=A0ABT0MAU2_9BACL|nr:hypothetical protein [Sporolactobacillus mangiferae]MCL1631399.1 hypothetical protein [Sporolactobacillus mangiferae]
MQVTHKKTIACYALIVLHLLLGIGAFIGGGLLILSPDGALLSMPLSLLKDSFFDNYLIPGLILFLFLGLYPLLVALFLITKKPFTLAEPFNLYKKTHWAWIHSLYVGFALIIWLTVEMYLLHGI